MKTNYKLNYYHFRKMVDRLFYGVALTEEHLTAAYTEIWDYIANSEDWRDYPELNKLRKKTYYDKNGKFVMVLVSYIDNEQEIILEQWQVENIITHALGSKLV